MKLLMENWRNYLNEEEHLNKELLDEGLLDWLKSLPAATRDSLKYGLQKIRQEIRESGEAGKLILQAVRGKNLSKEQLAFIKRQLRDIGVGTALLGLFFLPAGGLGIVGLVKLGKYYNIDILPSAFQEGIRF